MPTSFQMPQSIATTRVRPPRRLLGVGVQELVGGDVVDLPGRRGDRARRGEEHQPVEAAVGEQLVEHLGAVDLRRQHVLDRALGLGEQRAVVDDAGGVDHGVDAAEALGRRGDGGAHLLEVADVGRGDQHLGAERLQPLHGADARGTSGRSGRGGGGAASQPVARRQGRPADQHEPRPAVARQRLGDAQADAAEAAGDQADAALAQRRCCGGRQRRRARTRARSACRRAARRRCRPGVARRSSSTPDGEVRRAASAAGSAAAERPEAGGPLDGGQRRRRAAGR